VTSSESAINLRHSAKQPVKTRDSIRQPACTGRREFAPTHVALHTAMCGADSRREARRRAIFFHASSHRRTCDRIRAGPVAVDRCLSASAIHRRLIDRPVALAVSPTDLSRCRLGLLVHRRKSRARRAPHRRESSLVASSSLPSAGSLPPSSPNVGHLPSSAGHPTQKVTTVDFCPRVSPYPLT